MSELKEFLRIARELSTLGETLEALSKEIERRGQEILGLENQQGKVVEPESLKEMQDQGLVNLEKGEEAVIQISSVRSTLAEIARQGKRERVRELILSFGGEKLSDLNPGCYEELLQRAKSL